MNKKIFFGLAIIFLISAGAAFAINPNASIQKLIQDSKPVFVVNQSPIPVNVVNGGGSPIPSPSPTVQNWEYLYKCHPNPIDEQTINAYLNDKGDEGWEVVSAIGHRNLDFVCTYLKRPI